MSHGDMRLLLAIIFVDATAGFICGVVMREVNLAVFSALLLVMVSAELRRKR